MRSILLSLLLCSSLYAAESLLTLPKKEAKLSNGIRVYLVKYPSPGVVSYQLPVRVGSRNEVEKGKTGFAHFFEHLMFRGTKKMTGKQFSDLYTKLGAENNAWTWLDLTNYHGTVSSHYLPKILSAEADRFQNLSFDEKALRDEAGAVLGEYNKTIANPEFLLEEKLYSTAFTTHTYSHTTMGYKEDILKFPERYKDVWPFFKRYYRPSNMAIIVVGDVDFDKTLALIQKEFGKWKDPKEVPPTIPVEPKQTSPRFSEVLIDKPTQTRIAVAYKIPAFSTQNTDSASLAILSELEFSVTSDFQKEYRFDKKWVDDVSANPMDTRDPGLFTVQLRLAAAGEGKTDALISAVDAVMTRIRDNGVSSERLASAKQRFRNAAVTGIFSSPVALSERISWYTGLEPDLAVVDRVFQRIDEVTNDSLRNFAKDNLTPAQRTTIVLRSKANAN